MIFIYLLSCIHQGAVFGKQHIKPNFKYDDTETPVAKDLEILGFKIDEKM